MEQLKGERPSRVYDRFEDLIEDKRIEYSKRNSSEFFRDILVDDRVVLDPNSLSEGEIEFEGLDFRKIEGLSKFYDLNLEDDSIILEVRLGENEDSEYHITCINSVGDRGRIGNSLEDYLRSYNSGETDF